MSLLTAIYSHLVADADVIALTSTRIYMYEAPSSATTPYITFYQISGVPSHHLQAAAGITDQRVQIDCWDGGNEAATGVETLADKVRLAMDGFRGTMGTVTVRMCHLEDEGSDFFPKVRSSREGGIFRKRLDFRIWHTETVPTF